VCETFLKNQDALLLQGYKWFGNNRCHIHVNARRGSGGVGMFVKQSFLNRYRVTVLDDSTEDILWVKFADGKSEDMCVCVCYLPPSNSTRTNDAEQFFTTLLDQVSVFQNEGLMYICGDFNARCGDEIDYVEGVDQVCPREVVDHVTNKYVDLFTEFMIDCNICMCNGRINGKNDYTHVSHRGKSVVDYVLVPHEQLMYVSKFDVHLVSDIAEALSLQGCEKKPDHSILVWSCVSLTSASTTEMLTNTPMPATAPKYHVKQVPSDFMCSTESIQDTIRVIEGHLEEEKEADNAYSEFQKLLHKEMEVNLDKRRPVCYNNKPKGQRSFYKQYWTDELQVAWNRVSVKEKTWLKWKGHARERSKLKAEYCAERKRFDKLNRQHKRRFQLKKQEKLKEVMDSHSSFDFWKEIGNIGLSNNRKARIPFEVVDSNGHITTDSDSVFHRWKSDYENLYNTDICSSFNIQHMDTVKEQLDSLTVPIEHNIDVTALHAPITRTEVSEAILRAKLGKATGHDNIPVEVLRNGVCSDLLFKIISHCFEKGNIPSQWAKGIINPIPKANTEDPRDPLSYRGITLLCVPYKVYTDIINTRLSKWLETNRVLVEEQNGFRKKRSCAEHLYTLNNIVNTRKLSRKSTYVCFIDLKKAFDTVNRDCLWFKLL
jgi:hypothetical protein